MTLKRYLLSVGFILVFPIQGAHANEPSPTKEDRTNSEASDYRQEQDESLRDKRSTLDALLQSSIGSTTTPLRFDWRDSPAHFGINASQLLELNNFESWRVGALTRLPTKNFLWEFQLNYVYVRDSRSSRQLALTPYRQPGRPARFELDIGLNWPVAEGVVTPRFNWLPAVDLTLSAYGGLRYMVYPGIYRFDGFLNTLREFTSVNLSSRELEALEDSRLQSMEVVPNRYFLLAGFSSDIYMPAGAFFNLKTLFHIPFGVNPSTLTPWWWYELSASMGWAF
ncbi:MAG: hypothetical protein VX210_15565 [Myxococcota bacterium]|nr:hypothetical protein [Myxococcota bacterium]